MKKLLIILLLLPIMAQSQKGIGKKAIVNSKGKNVWFYGDSITADVAASTHDSCWAAILSAILGATENNHGVSGMTLVNDGCGTDFNESNIHTYNSSSDALLFLSFGTNDIGHINFPTAPTLLQYIIRVGQIISYAINAKGWPQKQIFVNTPYYALSYSAFNGGCSGNIVAPFATQARADSFARACDSVRLSMGVRGINIRNQMLDFTSANFNTDSLHPNNSGHRKIALKIKQLL